MTLAKPCHQLALSEGKREPVISALGGFSLNGCVGYERMKLDIYVGEVSIVGTAFLLYYFSTYLYISSPATLVKQSEIFYFF